MENENTQQKQKATTKTVDFALGEEDNRCCESCGHRTRPRIFYRLSPTWSVLWLCYNCYTDSPRYADYQLLTASYHS